MSNYNDLQQEISKSNTDSQYQLQENSCEGEQVNLNLYNKKNNNINYNIRHKKVKCSGDDVSSNHPLIYLDIKENAVVACPYCGKELKY